MAPNQVLQGSNVIATLNFQSSASQPSGYIKLPLNGVMAIKPTSVSYVNAISIAGQVAIVNNLAMLQAAAGPQSRTLTILGRVGNSYQVQYCTNFGASSVWYPLLTYSQTNIAQNVSVDPSLTQVYYRVQQQ